MKNTKRIFTPLLFILMFMAFAATAQKQIKEGIATYTATYDIPANELQNYGALPNIIVIFFRGDSSAAIVNQGGAVIKGVSVLKSNYHSMIIDIPAISKKIFVVMSSAEVNNENADIPKFTAKASGEKDVINGYRCTKTIINDTKTGAGYEIWLTNDIEMPPNSVSRPVSNFGGVPVKFVTFNHGVKIKAELQQIEEDTVAPGFFSATKDYQPLSYTELKNLYGGK